MPEENETVVRAFLAAHPDFQPAPLPEGISPDLTASPGMFRTFTHRHHMDGFFAVRLRRTAE